MFESNEYMSEELSKDLISGYLDRIAVFSDGIDYDSLTGLIEETKLPLAISNLIFTNGFPDRNIEGQMRLSNNHRRQHFNAIAGPVSGNGLDRVSIYLMSNRSMLGSSDMFTLNFFNLGYRGAIASERRKHELAANIYLLDLCAPFYAASPKADDNYPIYIDGASDTDTRVTSRAVIASEARVLAPQRLEGFMRVTSKLLPLLLDVAA